MTRGQRETREFPLLRLLPIAVVALSACGGCRWTGTTGDQGVLAMGVDSVAAEHGVVEFEGREPFEVMPPDAPALPAVRAGAVLDREAWALALFATGASEGQIVADIGCGKGRFSFDLARAVGTSGVVYCRDTADYKIEALRARMEEEGVSNLDLSVSDRDNVGIGPEIIDVALLSDVYVYVLKQTETKDAFLDSVYKCLKPGGVVVVVHVRSSHLTDEEKRQHVHRQTIEDFVAHGFEPGRRLVFAEVQTNLPGEILEFRRPLRP